MARGPKTNVPRGVFICSSDALNTYTNSAYQNMVGCSAEELLGLNWVKHIHPEDFQGVWIQALSLHEAGGLNVEFRLIHKDGSLRWVNCQSVDMPDCCGDGRYVGIIEDITWRKEAEESLKLSEERFALAVRGSNDGLWDWDIRTDKVFYSERYKNMLGVTCTEIFNTIEVLKDRLHPSYRDAVQTALEDYLTGNKVDGSPFHIEAPMSTSKDKYSWFRLRGQALWGTDGTALRMAGSLSDITERIQWEEEQERLIANLAEARDKAQSAAKARSEFLAIMSHEIRTPLNGVIGMASVLLDTDPTPDQVECLETIRTSGECLLSIVNDVLDFSKIDAGKLTISPMACNLRNLVEDVGSMLALRVEPKSVELVVHYEPPFSSVFADTIRLRQVLINLIGNACKFTHTGHILVHVCLLCQRCETPVKATNFWECLHCQQEADMVSDQPVKSAKQLRFSIVDSGIGIPAHKLGLLFEKFSQCDQTTSSMYGGTGLGLAVSKSLVELMGGKITVESQEGEGSSFSFTVPLELDTITESKHCHQFLFLNKPQPRPRVLVIDNHRMTKQVVCEQLENWGLDCCCFGDANTALKMMKDSISGMFHVVFIDHVLSEAIQRSQQVERLTDIFRGMKVVLVKPVGKRIYSQESLAQAGICVSISRPIRQSALRDAVLKALGQPGLKSHEKFSEPGQEKRESADSKQGVLKNPRVLVVEDNKVNQMVAIRLLNNLGCTVDVACNGEEAVSIIEQPVVYDLIFMDCHMPVLDGFQASRLIRSKQLKQPRRTPIVALTASTMEGELEKCLECGMDDYVRKPCTKLELQRALRKWLEVEEGRDLYSNMPEEYTAQ